jgi:hypothetical protein
MDVGEDTAASDGHAAKQLVKFLVIADRELKVARDNTGLLVVFCSVTSEFEDLSSEVLKNGSEVHGGTSTDALSVATSLQEAGNSADWELESSLG